MVRPPAVVVGFLEPRRHCERCGALEGEDPPDGRSLTDPDLAPGFEILDADRALAQEIVNLG